MIPTKNIISKPNGSRIYSLNFEKMSLPEFPDDLMERCLDIIYAQIICGILLMSLYIMDFPGSYNDGFKFSESSFLSEFNSVDILLL